MILSTGMLISIIGIISALALPSLGSLANAQIGANVGNNNYSFGNSNVNTNTTGSSLQNGPGMGFGGMNFSRLFEGTSFLGTIGISMVNGVKVTGLNLPSDNQVSVTLKNTNASEGANMTSPAVTVIAIRAAMSSKDIMSLIAASNNQNGVNASNMMTMMNGMNMMKSMQGKHGGFISTSSNSSNSLGNSLANASATSPGSNFNPMSFLENLQMGSTSIVNPNWKVPQTITMGLIGNTPSSGSSSSAALHSAAEFIIAIVIPYTGQSSLLSS